MIIVDNLLYKHLNALNIIYGLVDHTLANLVKWGVQDVTAESLRGQYYERLLKWPNAYFVPT